MFTHFGFSHGGSSLGQNKKMVIFCYYALGCSIVLHAGKNQTQVKKMRSTAIRFVGSHRFTVTGEVNFCDLHFKRS